MTTAPLPLAAPWVGPYSGVPAFNDVSVSAFKPALEASMEQMLKEVDAIATQKGKPTFENTVQALDSAGAAFERVATVYYVYLSTMSTPELREVEAEMAPVLAGLNDKIMQNAALFARIDAVYTGKKFKKLTDEQRRLTWRTHTDFVRLGARLDDAKKARLSEINQELAGHFTAFGQHLMAEEDTWTVIDDEARLIGLPPSFVASLAAAANEKGLPGQWIVMNTRSFSDPFLASSQDRDLREAVWTRFVSRGDNGDENDNNALIPQILKLRAERAVLLGYQTHAHWRLADAMAGTPEKAMALMEAVWKPAVARVAEEVADMQAIADAEGQGVTIAPWDYAFYQEKVRKDRYDLDQNQIKPYLQLDKMREAMFWVAGQLHGLQFKEVSGLPVVHPDVRVWEVLDSERAHVGLFYFDPFARSGKRSGAWMNAFRGQEASDQVVSPIISNNCNFAKGAAGEPVLISWDDANTLFHEFGHALHGLLSHVTYKGLAGTNVARDYVEFPSQLNEHWLSTPEVLNRFALHAETGQPMPAELLEKIEKAATFNQGFATVEYLASALMDMKLHLAGDAPINADTFERETLDALGMPKQLVMRHRTPQFAHVFSGDGYSAGYYSYLWADTLVADAAEAFVEAGSMYDAATAASLRANVLTRGNTVDPAEGFRAFRGRDVSIDALMRDKGFVE